MKRILVCIAVMLVLCSGVFATGTALPKGSTKINPKDGAVMVWVRAGEFIMGSTEKDIDAYLKAEPQLSHAKSVFEDEIPKRKVYLDGYWIYKNEVTIAQYRKFCKEAKKNMPETLNPKWTDDYPITNVTWQDAVDYAKWAGVALPTEAQWEKASRGTDGRIYPSGNKLYFSKYNALEKGQKEFQTVGSLTFNESPYGCMDMGGNVWEWCMDWYDPDYYKHAPQRNPKGPSKPVIYKVSGVSFSGHRVLRSGSFRCADRHGMRLTMANPYFGFRCAMKPYPDIIMIQ